MASRPSPRRLLDHIAGLARFAANRDEREREDAAALDELRARPLGLPPGLELEWLGVAGYRLAFEGRALYIDPYLSRAPLSAVIRRRPALSDPAVLNRHLPPADQVEAVLAGHTHFDHAIDIPEICRRYDAPAYGSRSLQRLMGLHGLGERATVVEPHRAYELGPFRVTFVPSVHSKLILGYAIPYDGELTCEHLDGLTPQAYRCGDVFGIHIEVAGVSLYHQGSCDLLDDEVRHRDIDFFLAGVAGRGFTEGYWQRILGLLQPKVVIPSHFDDFFRPVDGPQGFSLNTNLAAVPGEIERVSRDFRVAALPGPPASYDGGDEHSGKRVD